MLASIADEPNDNELASSAPVPAGVADDQMSSLHYVIHTELHHPPEGVSGYLVVKLIVSSHVEPDAAYTMIAELRSLTDPEQRALQGWVWIGQTPRELTIDDIPGWPDCTADPCVEDLELVVKRPAVAGLVVEVGGRVDVTTWGMPEFTPQDRQRIAITGPTR